MASVVTESLAPAAAPPGVGTLVVMDRTGDTKLLWSRDNPDEVANAKRTFADLKAKGFTAYRVGADGSKGEVIQEFDPTAEKIIMAPRVVGG